MTISSNLMKAILAMDSYNRSYNEGIKLTGTAVGTATILQTVYNGDIVNLDSGIFRDANENRLDQSIGFYAIAYQDNSTGAVTISYRGTDDQPKFWRGGLMPLGAVAARSSAGLSA